MGKLASIVLNWIGGGKTPIPVRFLKSVDIPGNAPNSGNNNIHILEVKDTLEDTSDEELLKQNLFLDGKPFEQSDISKIHIYDTFIKYGSYVYYGISYLMMHSDNIRIVAGYESQQLDITSIIKIDLSYMENINHFEITLAEV